MNEFVFPVKVYIEDTDYAGIVYHSNYLNYFERARSEWAEQWGLGIDWQLSKEIYFPVRSVQIDYLKPARLNNMLEVVTKIIKVGRASLVYDQYLRLASVPDILLCKAVTKIACVDKYLRPCALPNDFNNLTGDFV